MATATPTKTKGGIGGGVIVLLLLAALALSHAKLAPGGSGGSGGGYPNVGRHLANDPCPEGSHPDTLAHEPWERVIRQQKVGGQGTRTETFYLTCEHWRRMVDTEITFGVSRAEWPDAETVIKCIGNVLLAGAFTQSGPDSQQFRLTVNQNPGADITVIANADNDVRFVGLTGDVTWQECAA